MPHSHSNLQILVSHLFDIQLLQPLAQNHQILKNTVPVFPGQVHQDYSTDTKKFQDLSPGTFSFVCLYCFSSSLTGGCYDRCMKSKILKVVMYPAISLDGFIADLDGECYSWISDEDEASYTQAIEEAGCVLLGRKTYEQYPDDFPPESGATAFIWTTRKELQNQERVKFVQGTAQEVLRQIADAGFSKVIVGGGGEVNGSLAKAGLVDEIIVSIYGVTIGEGIPLFGTHKPNLKLRLLETTNEVDGIIKNHYEVSD